MNIEHTLMLKDDGLQLVNGFEKVFLPWDSIVFAKEDENFLVVELFYKRGIYVINKNRYSSPNLSVILEKIKTNCINVGGAK